MKNMRSSILSLNMKSISRLALVSLLLTASGGESPALAAQAMEITDETAHEQVYSGPDGAEGAGAPDGDGADGGAEDEVDYDDYVGEPTPDAQGDEAALEGDEMEAGSEPAIQAVDATEGGEGDYVEESDTPDGRHVRKEVHQGPGFKTVRVTTSGGSAPPAGGRGATLMQAMMQEMM